MSALRTLEQLSPQWMDDKDVLRLVEAARAGIPFSAFYAFINKSPFTLSDWATFLPISERTLQRYRDKKENVTLDKHLSEKVLEIALLFRRGAEVFGAVDTFFAWLSARNMSIGGIA